MQGRVAIPSSTSRRHNNKTRVPERKPRRSDLERCAKLFPAAAMTRLMLLWRSPGYCRIQLARPHVQNFAFRTLFTLPDLSKLAPLSARGGDSREPHAYHERKILPSVAPTQSITRTMAHFLFSYCRKDLYKVVSDVASYPRFLPFCTSTRILSQTPLENPNALGLAGTVRMEAEMTVGFMTIQESYVSEVTCVPYELVQVRESGIHFAVCITIDLNRQSRRHRHHYSNSFQLCGGSNLSPRVPRTRARKYCSHRQQMTLGRTNQKKDLLLSPLI